MKHDGKTKRLGEAPVGKLFLKLALPAVFGQLAILLNNIVDRIWVGHIGGDGMLSLGAVGISLPIHHVFLAIILMLAAGMAPCVSILLGKGDRERAAHLGGTCFGLGLIVNLFAFLIVFCFTDPLLLAFGAGADSLPFAHAYLKTLAWGMPFANTLLMLTIWFSSQGHVSEGVRLNMISVGINAVLDPVFIFLCGLGVTGAALATNAGAVLALVVGVVRLARSDEALRFGLRDLLPRRELFIRPVMLGLSTLLNVALESISLLFLNASLQRYGGDLAVATMSLFGMPLLVLMNLCLGLSHGAQPIIGYNFGNGRLDRVRAVCRHYVFASFACSLVLWLLAMIAPNLLWCGFTSDAELLRYASDRTRLFFSVLLFGGIQYAHIYIIKFLGLIRISLFLGVLKRLVLLLPLIFLLPLVLPCEKTTAVLAASPISEALAFLVTAACQLHVMRNLKVKGPK